MLFALEADRIDWRVKFEVLGQYASTGTCAGMPSILIPFEEMTMRKDTWILVASSAKAKILEDKGDKQPLKVIRLIENPAGRANAAALVTDRPSRSRSSVGERSALAPRIGPHRNVQEHFARVLIDAVDAGHRRNAFGNLIIASSRPFLGILLEECGEHLRRALRKRVPRSLYDLPLDEVREVIDKYKAPLESRL